MKSCKKNLCFKPYVDDDETDEIDDIALPFFEAMKIFIIKVPTKGMSIFDDKLICPFYGEFI